MNIGQKQQFCTWTMTDHYTNTITLRWNLNFTLSMHTIFTFQFFQWRRRRRCAHRPSRSRSRRQRRCRTATNRQRQSTSHVRVAHLEGARWLIILFFLDLNKCNSLIIRLNFWLITLFSWSYSIKRLVFQILSVSLCPRQNPMSWEKANFKI